MKIVMVASEVAPFSKEGGLADVLGALPVALAGLGHDVTVITPLYRGVRAQAERIGWPLERLEPGVFPVPIGDTEAEAALWVSRLPDSNVRVVFLQNDRYYDRGGFYTNSTDHTDYSDNAERFIFLARGALEACRFLHIEPDVVHAHDWHTGLVPVYMKHVYAEEFGETPSVFTIHNLAYQGLFWHWDMKTAGLPWELFTWRQLEYYGNLCFLKAGLVFADALTTVSRTYGREVQTEQYGCGMHGVLQERAEDLHGIINGIDQNVWNPATDPWIAAHYDADDLAGKRECKAALQQRFDLTVDIERPLVGLICRLVDQKGLDLLAEALPTLVERDVQFVILGTGEPRYHRMLENLAADHPDSFACMIAYDEELAHMIEAGSDIFLMPSRFEPCGLNQLYSMRYGTVPVVRATGGLADTVRDPQTPDVAAQDAAGANTTGFAFTEYSATALISTLERALATYADKDAWRRLMLNGMAQDWSWRRSAREYEALYEKLTT